MYPSHPPSFHPELELGYQPNFLLGSELAVGVAGWAGEPLVAAVAFGLAVVIFPFVWLAVGDLVVETQIWLHCRYRRQCQLRVESRIASLPRRYSFCWYFGLLRVRVEI